MVSLPYSATRRYLTGIDWVIGALDHLTRARTGAGIPSQVVLELDRHVDEQDLRLRLAHTARAMPVLTGQPARDTNLAPYWKTSSAPDSVALPLTVHRRKADARDDVLTCLADAVNRPFASNSQHLAFHLVCPESSPRCFLAMTFDHRLLDARGAELFLDAVQKGNPPPSAPEPAHLDRWIRRFRAGRHVNRTFAGMSGSAIDTIPLPAELRGKRSRFAVFRFSREQTTAISRAAEAEAGYLMLMPYVLAVTLRQLDGFLADHGHPRGNYVVPVSMDMRSRKPSEHEILFNHLAFLLLHLTADAVNDRAALIRTIKQQVYDQTRLGLPQHIHDATMLLRIAPPWLLAGIMLKIRLLLGSFSFSCVGGSAYASETFMNARVLDLFHMPRVPVPPGYGFFFNEFDSRLNMVFSWVEGLLSDSEASELAKRVESSLLNAQAAAGGSE